jgi:hypothetical protein
MSLRMLRSEIPEARIFLNCDWMVYRLYYWIIADTSDWSKNTITIFLPKTAFNQLLIKLIA